MIETQIRVRYAETDQSGIVYHANYFVWFEVARGEFFWQRGLDYVREVEGRGLVWPVVEANVRYLLPARYGDIVTVRAQIAELHSRAMTIRYEIVHEGQMLCTGYTKHLNVDRTGRVVAFPPELRDLLVV